MYRVFALALPISCFVLFSSGLSKQAEEAPDFILIPPSPEYNAQLRAARASQGDYFWERHRASNREATYDSVKDFLAPVKYVNAPWRYLGVIMSPKGSPQKIRVIENGFRIDASLERSDPQGADAWTPPKRSLRVHVGSEKELFGLDERRQGLPVYEDGYLPILHTTYMAEGTLYEQSVLAWPLNPDYISGYLTPGVAAYVRITARQGGGRVAFEFEAPPVDYGFPIVPAGFRDDIWADGHNNIHAWFSEGGTYGDEDGLIHFQLGQGESVYVIFPHQAQPAGTIATATRRSFERAIAEASASWNLELSRGARVEVPEAVVMEAYRSLLIGDWQVSIGDELPYGMFSYYEGNGYAEALQTIAPFIEYGYFDDSRRFIQPILDYPLSDTGIGLHVCANRLELAAYYFAMSGDTEFIRSNRLRLMEVADYFLAHREESSGLVLDGYGFDLADQQVVNINTNTNGWRAIRNLGLALQAAGEDEAGARYLEIAEDLGRQVRKVITDNVDYSTTPPFVPFALGFEKPYESLVESKASGYYNIVMPYFFESEIFEPDAAPYTHVLDYMWNRQGVMAGLNRFDQHGVLPLQDGIHPLYTWGRQFAQISRHDVERAIYTFYCSLAHGYSRGTYLTGENQSAVPSEKEWYRGAYLPPEPPANALLLRSLRHMLLHEHDIDQDGRYDELWLLSAMPNAWLEDGKKVLFSGMPSRFGEVDLRLDSRLDKGQIGGYVKFGAAAGGEDVLLFVRLPGGYRVTSAAQDDGTRLQVTARDHDPVVLLSARPGGFGFTVQVTRE